MIVENKLSAPIHLSRFLLSDFTHIARSYANLLEQKKAITEEFNAHRLDLEQQHGRRFIVL